MTRYLVRRFLQALFVLWSAYTVCFAVLYLLPSDPVSLMVSAGSEQSMVDDAQVEALRAQYGLDRPVTVQYVDHLWHALRGDFGVSVQSGRDVTRVFLDVLPATLELAAAAFALALLLGLGLAYWGTYARRSWIRQTLLSIPPFWASLPTFWVGLMLVQLVSFRWGLLPATGNEGTRSLLLPAVTLALPTAAGIAQVFARSLRATETEHYITTAAAKGASPRRVHLRHSARNAALPALTLAGVWAGNLLAGSVVVETVFSRTGVGRTTATAVGTQDIPVVLGLVILSSLLFTVVNLAVDLTYPLLDPRILGSAATHPLKARAR
ncbi:peptide ABC transporter permease [Parafrankia colletiae]|uniref:Peptide ABC transporter permease n=1 Tax=Parafrankia colletiae TaxID=573497 RepID=A0A1S1R2B4_9ACTN|nr:ABC transporter permease [Parafrankia colletiae]MCK9903755.1 ABC transporter permease [Frankia sp. Cpl3]OHV40310.1 peptide ABC transporter permease [Parafrankia colletiae]